MPNIRPRLKGIAYVPQSISETPAQPRSDIVAYQPMYYTLYNISHAHYVTSLLRMLKYHTCDLSFRGLLPWWLLLCSCSVLAVSLDVYPRLLLCPCSVLAVFLFYFSCVLRDLWPSVSSTSDCVFKPDTKRRRLSLSGLKKRWELLQKIPSPEIKKAKHGYIPVNAKRKNRARTQLEWICLRTQLE